MLKSPLVLLPSPGWESSSVTTKTLSADAVASLASFQPRSPCYGERSGRCLVSVLIAILMSAEISQSNSSDLQGGSSAQVCRAAHKTLGEMPAHRSPCPPAAEDTRAMSICLIKAEGPVTLTTESHYL